MSAKSVIKYLPPEQDFAVQRAFQPSQQLIRRPWSNFLRTKLRIKNEFKIRTAEELLWQGNSVLQIANTVRLTPAQVIFWCDAFRREELRLPHSIHWYAQRYTLDKRKKIREEAYRRADAEPSVRINPEVANLTWRTPLLLTYSQQRA